MPPDKVSSTGNYILGKARRSPGTTVTKHVRIPVATIKKLKALVQCHRNNNRVASWELGRLASKCLDHTGKQPASRLAVADLAERIGLIPPTDPSKPDMRRDESNLRQLMKFGRVATGRQAVVLDKVGIAWRGVVYWIGVNDKGQRDKLYREIVSGQKNSNEIRNYVAKHFKKAAPPRRHVDIARVGENAQVATRRLIGTLASLNDRLDEHARAGKKKKKMPAAQRRKLAAALDEVIQSVKKTKPKLT